MTLPDSCSIVQVQDNDLLPSFWVQGWTPTFSPKSHHSLWTLPPDSVGPALQLYLYLVLLCGFDSPVLHDTSLQEQSPGVYACQQKGCGSIKTKEYSIHSNDSYQVIDTFLCGKHGFQKISLTWESVFDWLYTPTRRKLLTTVIKSSYRQSLFLIAPLFLSWSSAGT